MYSIQHCATGRLTAGRAIILGLPRAVMASSLGGWVSWKTPCEQSNWQSKFEQFRQIRREPQFSHNWHWASHALPWIHPDGGVTAVPGSLSCRLPRLCVLAVVGGPATTLAACGFTSTNCFISRFFMLPRTAPPIDNPSSFRGEGKTRKRNKTRRDDTRPDQTRQEPVDVVASTESLTQLSPARQVGT